MNSLNVRETAPASAPPHRCFGGISLPNVSFRKAVRLLCAFYQSALGRQSGYGEFAADRHKWSQAQTSQASKAAFATWPLSTPGVCAEDTNAALLPRGLGLRPLVAGRRQTRHSPIAFQGTGKGAQ